MKRSQEKFIRFFFSNIGEPLGVYAKMDKIFSSISADADDFKLRTVFLTSIRIEVISYISGSFIKKHLGFTILACTCGKSTSEQTDNLN